MKLRLQCWRKKALLSGFPGPIHKYKLFLYAFQWNELSLSARLADRAWSPRNSCRYTCDELTRVTSLIHWMKWLHINRSQKSIKWQIICQSSLWNNRFVSVNTISIYLSFNQNSEPMHNIKMYESGQEKTCFCPIRTTNVIRLHAYAVWSATLLFAP